MEDVCRLFAVVDGNGELVGSVPASWFQDAETHKSLEVFCQRLVNFDHCWFSVWSFNNVFLNVFLSFFYPILCEVLEAPPQDLEAPPQDFGLTGTLSALARSKFCMDSICQHSLIHKSLKIQVAKKFEAKNLRRFWRCVCHPDGDGERRWTWPWSWPNSDWLERLGVWRFFLFFVLKAAFVLDWKHLESIFSCLCSPCLQVNNGWLLLKHHLWSARQQSASWLRLLDHGGRGGLFGVHLPCSVS